MSTISSPRLSVASSRARSPTPSSSRRQSLDPQTTPSTPSLARAVSPSIQLRRNRTALRDYYNLRPPQTDAGKRSRSIPRTGDGNQDPTTTGSTTNQPIPIPAGTELDNPDFNPQAYVDNLLFTSSLSTVLKAENTLVGDIRTLDSERKALVYDNYSKLIRAVETIGRMRRSMEERGTPLTMTETLGPSIAFVAESAGGLIQEGEVQRRVMREVKFGEGKGGSGGGDDDGVSRRRVAEKETVRWVLDAPERLGRLLADGKREEAEMDWTEIRGLLEKWDGIRGVSDVRDACVKVMEGKGDSHS